MTEADWLEIVGAWAGCWATGYTAGLIQRWFQGIAEKL
jgi:hypothetical protein